ncbi:MAG: hypothetical protein IJT97_11240 [Bacteroidaceae bacterium]|nr:hypothetical protein [Bacteroidaceae bacterium]
MEFVTNEIKNLIKVMLNNKPYFESWVLSLYSVAELTRLVCQTKFYLSITMENSEEADNLELLNLKLQNAIRNA